MIFFALLAGCDPIVTPTLAGMVGAEASAKAWIEGNEGLQRELGEGMKADRSQKPECGLWATSCHFRFKATGPKGWCWVTVDWADGTPHSAHASCWIESRVDPSWHSLDLISGAHHVDGEGDDAAAKRKAIDQTALKQALEDGKGP